MQLLSNLQEWMKVIPWYVTDISLMLLFVIQHSLLTTEYAVKIIGKLTNPNLWNLVYNILTFLVTGILIVFWQHTDVYLWKLTGFWYYALWGLRIILVFYFFYLFKYTTTVGQWLGISQLFELIRKQPKKEYYKIKKTNIKRYIRFPHHTCLLGMFWSQPVVSTDYLLLAIGASIYLWLGSVHQDYRGLKIFGEEWKEYSEHSHILFPRPKILLADLRKRLDKNIHPSE